MPHQAQNAEGQSINPGDGIVPILKEIEPGRLAVIGTGFYVTRYGLFATAGHVVEALANQNRTTLEVCYVLHLSGQTGIHLRKIVSASFLQNADVAVCQADNYISRYPADPLMNMRGRLTREIPASRSPLVTYAYPDNETLEFTEPDCMPVIRGNYFNGEMLQHVISSEHPFIPYPHFETSISIRSGASGGPVFDSRGRIVGINCRGWDFGSRDAEESSLSYVVPIEALLELEVPLNQLPPASWEAGQVPVHLQSQPLKVSQLADFGHIDFG